MSNRLTQDVIVAKYKTDDLKSIKNLSLWGNDIEDINILTEMSNLEVVSLSGNKISSLNAFSKLEKLSELYLRRNNIQNLNELICLKDCKNLKILWIDENPCSSNSDYRIQVIRCLPQLLKLDNLPVTDEERGEAAVTRSNNRRHTVEVLTTSCETVENETDRSTISLHCEKRRSSITKLELKGKRLVVSQPVEPQKKKSKSKLPTKRIISLYKSYESSNGDTSMQRSKESKDQKENIVSAIENLIKVLESPDLKHVRNIIDKKLNL